ncbi:radical SAM protein [bacterium]|nr:radical SAM protein [bacterium]
MRYLSCLRAMLTRRLPIYVHYGVTHRCNLQCRMCGLWKLGNQTSELTLPQIQQLAANLGKLGTTAISLGGGEPFLRQDLPDIAEAFLSNGLEVRILTNGLVKNDELIQRVLATGVRHISISLDTLDAAVQDDICSRQGAWHDIIEAVRFWAGALQPRRGLGVLNCVVSKLNFRQIPKLLQVADAYGFYLSLVPIELHHYQDRDLGCRDNFENMHFVPEEYPELDRIFGELISIKRRGRSRLFNSTPYLRYSLSYLKGQPLPGFRCRAGALSFSVSPEGNYSMCHYYKGLGPAGHSDAQSGQPISAADPGFPEWYRQSQAAVVTSLTSRACRCCFRPCWQEINLAFTNPTALWEAWQLQRPLPYPDKLPSADELRSALSLT